MEQKALSDRYVITSSPTSSTNAALVQQVSWEGLRCPSGTIEYCMISDTSRQRNYTTHYYGIQGPLGENVTTGEDYRRYTNISASGVSAQGLFTACTSAYRDAIDFAAVTDGLSNTLAFGEISWNEYTGYREYSYGAYWISSTDVAIFATKDVQWPINVGLQSTSTVYRGYNTIGAFGSHHPGGANFSLADGSVRFLPETISMDTYLALASRNGGEVTQTP